MLDSVPAPLGSITGVLLRDADYRQTRCVSTWGPRLGELL